METIFVSPSKLSILKECDRCFFDTIHKIAERPRGIFSSMPTAVDSILKGHYDRHRGEGMVPEMKGKVYGRLFSDQDFIKNFRKWQTCPTYVDNTHQITLRGAGDDLILEPDGTYSPFDYKSRGSAPTKGYALKYSQTQMGLQALMLHSNGKKMSGKAHLAYYYFKGSIVIGDFGSAAVFPIGCEVQTLDVDIDRAKALIDRAGKIIRGKRPSSTVKCEYCDFVYKRVLAPKE